jgi:hypothetical protein
VTVFNVRGSRLGDVLLGGCGKRKAERKTRHQEKFHDLHGVTLLIHWERQARLWAGNEVNVLSGGADEKPSVLHASYTLCCARLMNALQRTGDGIVAPALILQSFEPDWRGRRQQQSEFGNPGQASNRVHPQLPV